jgi:hypothetical protein
VSSDRSDLFFAMQSQVVLTSRAAPPAIIPFSLGERDLIHLMRETSLGGGRASVLPLESIITGTTHWILDLS